MNTPRRRLAWRALALGLALGLGACLLAASAPGQRWEQRVGLAWLFALRGALDPPAGVVLVTLSGQDTAAFSASHRLRDWRRTHHAELLDKLFARGVSVVGFDITFEDPRPDDTRFAAALARYPVVLFQRARPAPDLLRQGLAGDRLLNPSPALARAAAGLAPFPLPKQRDHRVDQFWAFFDRVNDAPTLPLTTLQLHVIRTLGYRQFTERLRIAGFDAGLAQRAPADAAELRMLMDTLRRGFQARPALAARLAAEAPALAALAAAYAGPAHPFFNFYGPPGTLVRVPYSHFWRAPEEPELPELRGKIVLVGADAPELHDEFGTVFTAADGSEISGLEALASATANLLEQRTLRPPSAALQTGLLIAFGLLAAALALPLPGLAAAAGVALLSLAYLLLAVQTFAHTQLWLPLFIPLLLQAPLALAGGLLWRDRHWRQATAKLRRALSLYLPARAAARLSADPGEDRPLRPERVRAVCLVSDVAGFTTLAERLPAERLAALSNAYFARLIAALERGGGEMMDILGDGMTCAWPTADQDRPTRLRACLTALDIIAAVDDFNRDHPHSRFPTRIGLNVGWLAMGNLGGSGRFSFGLAGDVANTASRLEGLNKTLGTRLLAAAEVVSELDDELLCRRVGWFRLQGKSAPLTVFEIVRRRPDAGADPRLLCERFATALALFEAGRVDAAGQAFAALCARFPNDGPSRFYRRRCARVAAPSGPIAVPK